MAYLINVWGNHNASFIFKYYYHTSSNHFWAGRMKYFWITMGAFILLITNLTTRQLAYDSGYENAKNFYSELASLYKEDKKLNDVVLKSYKVMVNICIKKWGKLNDE